MHEERKPQDVYHEMEIKGIPVFTPRRCNLCNVYVMISLPQIIEGFRFPEETPYMVLEHSSLNYPDKMDGSGNLFARGLLQEFLWKDM